LGITHPSAGPGCSAISGAWQSRSPPKERWGCGTGRRRQTSRHTMCMSRSETRNSDLEGNDYGTRHPTFLYSIPRPRLDPDQHRRIPHRLGYRADRSARPAVALLWIGGTLTYGLDRRVRETPPAAYSWKTSVLACRPSRSARKGRGRPLSCSRPQTIPDAGHDTVANQDDDGRDTSVHE
jgi:hypothetical protein